MTEKMLSIPVADGACAATPVAWRLEVPRGQSLLVRGQRAVLWRVTRGAFQIEQGRLTIGFSHREQFITPAGDEAVLPHFTHHGINRG